MKLFLSRCTASLSSGSCTPLFLLYDHLGGVCGRVERLSGLFTEAFHVSGRLPTGDVSVCASRSMFPSGCRYVIQSDRQKRAKLTVLPDGTLFRVEVDRMPCSLLGTPSVGEYTLTDPRGQVLFSQKMHAAPEGRWVYVLSIQDEARADVYLGIAVSLSRNIAAKTGVFTPVVADP